jgi:hypothetical protein
MVEQDELTAIEHTLIRKAFSEIVRFQDMIMAEFAT